MSNPERTCKLGLQNVAFAGGLLNARLDETPYNSFMTESTDPDITDQTGGPPIGQAVGESIGLSQRATASSLPNDTAGRTKWSLRTLFAATTFIALVAGNAISIFRLRDAREELSQLRLEVGSLHEIPNDQLAAIRMPADLPLTYKFRVQTPLPPERSERWNSPSPPRSSYRIAYSTILPRGRTQPDWYSAIAVSPGESVVTIRIAVDPRDELWKISTLVQNATSTRRMGTVLPDAHTKIFRASHDVISTGVARQSVTKPADGAIRLLDERWLVGEQALLLYGDRAPDEDQVGVYAELQSTDEPLS